jgi:hypothetical protein
MQRAWQPRQAAKIDTLDLIWCGAMGANRGSCRFAIDIIDIIAIGIIVC